MQKYKFNIIEDLTVELTVKNNLLNIPLENMFSMAARINPKRSFLFVSKLLGKHIAVDPRIPIVTGALLSDILAEKLNIKSPFDRNLLTDSLLNEVLLKYSMKHIENNKISLDKPTLFVGFAETATGLAHSMFSVFDKNAEFIHTTRDSLKSSFNFEEEHPHATSHLCYALEDNYFDKFERIVLVDDEMTTGKTNLNLIRALNKKYPNKEYIIVTILDFRNSKEILNYSKFERELGIKLDTISLLQGEIKCNNIKPKDIYGFNTSILNPNPIKVDTKVININEPFKYRFNRVLESGKIRKKDIYLKFTGRFGLSAEDNNKYLNDFKKLGALLKEKREYDKTLVMGYEEFIYIPCFLASFMGEGVKYQSPTRSPIYLYYGKDYPVKTVISINNPYDKDIKNYIYNIIPNQYDEVFMIFERKISYEFKGKIIDAFQDMGIKSVNFIYFE